MLQEDAPAPTRARRLAISAAATTPLLLAAATLLAELSSSYSDRFSLRFTALFALVFIPVFLALIARGRGALTLASHLVAAPALLAPLAVCFPWTVAPSHLGLGFGEFGFFLHWLTRYPNFGPVNYEILLGILCVLGCAFLPWLAAALRLHQRSSRTTAAALLVLALIPYLPVLRRLDITLFAIGTLRPSGSLQPAPPIWVVFGPALRLAAIASMIGMLFDGRAGVISEQRAPDP